MTVYAAVLFSTLTFTALIVRNETHARSLTQSTSSQDTAGPALYDLLVKAGYPYGRIDEGTWRLTVQSKTRKEVAVFVTESRGAVAFLVKLARRAQLPSDPSLRSTLLAQNSQLNRSKLVVSDAGDLLLSSTGALRTMDVAAFRAQVEEIVNSAETIAAQVSSLLSGNAKSASDTTPQKSMAAASSYAGEPIPFAWSIGLGPRRKGKAGNGLLVVQAHAIAFQAVDREKAQNDFSASCGELLNVNVLEDPQRLHIDLHGQSYELFGGDCVAAAKLVSAACKHE
jgi:hypothetical protein